MTDDPKPTPQPIDLKGWSIPALLVVIAGMMAYQQWRGPVVPTPVPVPPAPIVVPVKVDPTDAIVERDGVRLDAEKTKLFCEVVNAGDGTFTVSYQPVGKKRVTRTIVVSGDVVPPIPVPPGPVPPGPNPPPVPPKPDVVSGPRGILIVQQVENESDAFSAMMVKLRSGASAEYLKSKGHKLYHLDPDDTGANGQPSEIVEAWRPHFKDMKLPVEIIFDPATKQLLSKRELPDTTTDANVIESVRQQGG